MICFCVGFLINGHLFAQEGEPRIFTVAGNGERGFSGDGGLATLAKLDYPGSVIVDSLGNVYIGDSLNRRIRRVDATTHVITTIAGDGKNSYANQVLATQTSASSSYGLFLDDQGNLYFTDENFGFIRKLDLSTGIVSSVAGRSDRVWFQEGALATETWIALPIDVCLDRAGNIYLADLEGHRVLRIDVDSKRIRSVAGNGFIGYSGDGGLATHAQLHRPRSICLDESRQWLYIVDENNYCIRKVDLNTGIINTIAGTGLSGFWGDGAVATDALFGRPSDVCLDAVGNLYIADRENHRIRKIDIQTDNVFTIVGTGLWGDHEDGVPISEASIKSLGGLYVDRYGTLYFTDTGHDRVLKVEGVVSLHNQGVFDSVNNIAPVAVNDTVTVLMNRGVLVDAIANDFDADGDELKLLSVMEDSSGGRISVHEDKISYSLPYGFTGTQMLRYKISDGRGGTAIGVVVIRVLVDQKLAVQQAVRSVGSSIMSRDAIRLLGYMPEDTVYTTPGASRKLKPYQRQMITTVALDYSVKKRRALRAYLEAFFNSIPQDIMVYVLDTEITLSEDQMTATAKVSQSFREVFLGGNVAWASRSSVPLIFYLKRIDETWLVTEFEEIVKAMGEPIIGPFPKVHPPMRLRPLPDVTIALNDSIFQYSYDLLGAEPIFTDAEGDSLQFTGQSSHWTVVSPRFDGSVMTFKTWELGQAVIVVTADDGYYGREIAIFSVYVTTQTLLGQKSVSPDFDQNGVVNFQDFLIFAQAFGSESVHCDLDGDGQVGFSDFLIFVQSFGK